MARRLDPIISRQELLRAQLWGSLQGDVLDRIRLIVDGEQNEYEQRSDMAAGGIRVSEKTMPETYSLFEDVLANLEFNEPIELYIQSSTEVNATAYTSEYEDKPHIIILTSALYNLMDENELKFIIGHEIGHLINHDSKISKLYNYVYRRLKEEYIPSIISTRYNQYHQLAEYAADRYGYLACMDLNASLSAFYKMNSGLDLKKMNVNIDYLTDDNNKNINYLLQTCTVTNSDHPMTPFRVGAIVEFAKCPTQKKLEEHMDILFNAIPGYFKSELDINMAICIAASGYKLANISGKMGNTEKRMILDKIAEYEFEANKLLKRIAKGDIDRALEITTSVIKDLDSSKFDEIIEFYVELLFADDIITHEEIDKILELGHSFGYEDIDIMNFITKYIQEDYNALSDYI